MRAFLSIIIAALAAGAWGSQQARIEVRELSVVQNAQFTLGEVATFRGVDAQMQVRLAGVVLGTSPLPGLERAISIEQIVTRLRQHGIRPEALEIVAPTKIIVRREAHLVRAQHAIDAAIQKLRETVSLPDDAQAVCDVPVRDLSLPSGDVQVSAGEPRSLGAGLYVVPVQLHSAGASPVTLNVRLRVSRWREVLVAQRTIRAGEAIDGDMVAVQRMVVAQDDPDLVSDPAAVTGKIARLRVAAGQPLKRSAVEEPAVIRRGQNVKLLVRLTGAVVETGAVALQDGKVSGRIRVQVTDTRKTLWATVLDAETVTVDMP
jgi:flagella basal body P-ring formation protein FlgA